MDTKYPNFSIRTSKKSQRKILYISTGRSNGMAFDNNGDIIAWPTCMKKYGIYIYMDSSHDVLVNNYNSITVFLKSSVITGMENYYTLDPICALPIFEWHDLMT